MKFNMNDYVTRKSHNHDIVFKIVHINNKVVILKGVDFRLYADAMIDDLVLCENNCNDDNEIIENNIRNLALDRDNYFYLPGKILHIDGDKDYLDRCMFFYERMGIKANGISLAENVIHTKIKELINEFRPDIIVITGHDALVRRGDKSQFENSDNFALAVKEARKYEKNQDKLIIIAGACQSNYELLIKCGANFASSPKKINIHALDPAIIASSLAMSDKNKCIDLINIIKKTKYGSDGIGGIITNGTMYVGYPR